MTPPPSSEALVGLAAKLTALGENLERIGAAFDALAPPSWLLPIGSDLQMRLAERWVSGPSCLIEMLGYARDEEAFVFGRRAMRILQEHEPLLEHLTFELASAYTPYRATKAAIHFSELTKSRLTWLQMAAAAGPFGEMRVGDLPPEEGGGRVRLEEIASAALSRDAALVALVSEVRSELGVSAKKRG